MNLFELRFLFLALLLSYCLISITLQRAIKDKRCAEIAQWIVHGYLVLILTVFGLCVTTTQYTDMVRMSQDMQQAIVEGDLGYLYRIYSTSPLSATLVSLGVITRSSRVTQAVATLIFYGCFFISLGIIQHRIKTSLTMSTFVVIWVLLAVDFTQVSTNGRFWSGAGLALLSITIIEIAHHGSAARFVLGCLLGVASLAMHYGFIGLFMVYAVVKLVKSKVVRIVWYMVFLAQYFLMKPIVNMLNLLPFSYARMLGDKISLYYGLVPNFEETYDATRPFSWWLLIFITIAGIAATCIVVFIVNRQAVLSTIMNDARWLLAGVVFFAIGSLYSWTLSGRYAAIGTAVAVPSFLYLFSNHEQANKTVRIGFITLTVRQILQMLICFLIIVMLGMLIVRYRTTYANYFVELHLLYKGDLVDLQ